MLLSGSGHLFQCILRLKYIKVLSSHTLPIIATLYEMALPNSLVKSFKVLLSELSLNIAMIFIPDFFLTRLVGSIYLRAKQMAYLMYKCINNLPQLISENCLPQLRTPNYDLRTKNWLPEEWLQLRWRYSMEQSSWGNTYIKFRRFLYEKFP